MASEARRFLSAILQENSVQKLMGYGNLSPLYSLETAYQPAYEFVDNYIRLSGKLPTRELVEKECHIALGEPDAASEFLYERLRGKHIEKRLKLVSNEIKEYIGSDPTKALEVMTQITSELQVTMRSSELIDFKKANTTLIPSLHAKWSGGMLSVPFGWPTLDNMTAGLRGGDLVSIVGRPGSGKTWLLLFIANCVWEALNMPILFVSMEMNRFVLMERMAALYSHIPMSFFKDGLSENLFADGPKEKMYADLAALEKSDKAPFYILDSKLTANVTDILSLVQMIKPAAVFIDGAYMLSHPFVRDKYAAVAANTHLLKGELSERLGVPTFCTWQFSRDAMKVKKGETPGLEHIGYSDTIGQLSSIVLGLFEEEEQDNVELHVKRNINILKGRGGEAGEFKCRWDFDNIDFTEYLPTDKQEVYGL